MGKSGVEGVASEIHPLQLLKLKRRWSSTEGGAHHAPGQLLLDPQSSFGPAWRDSRPAARESTALEL